MNTNYIYIAVAILAAIAIGFVISKKSCGCHSDEILDAKEIER